MAAGENGQSTETVRSPPLRCNGCGYGATRNSAPDRCPMCGGSSWDYESWRPFSALLRDLAPPSGVLREFRH
jgi:hypothetical protein